jgi:predicted MFS family arabinose efflux permease
VRRLLGDEIEPELRPLLAAVTLGFCGVFSFVAFFAVWAIGELRLPPGQVGLAFTGAAVAGVLGAVLGGRLSDRVGRKPVIVAAAAGQTAVSAALLLPMGRAGAFAVLAGLSFLQPLRGATQRALAADLVRPERLESGFAALRIGINLGGSSGPLLGAALVTVGWGALHLGTTLLFAGSLAAALRLPQERRRSTRAVAGPGVAGLVRVPAFRLVFAASVLAWIVYQAFETVLPASLAGSYGVAPAAWGLVFAVNPALTVLLQLRVTRWSRGLRTDAKLALALALMGLPFLALPVLGAPLALVVAVVLCVTLGEMLWAPASETLVVDVAPPGSRGAALGLATAASWLGTAAGPAVALQVGGAFGDGAMWGAIAGVAAAGAALYAVALRAAQFSVGSSGMSASRRNSPPLRRSTSLQSDSGLPEKTSSASAGSTIQADSASSASSCPSAHPA